MSVLSNGFGSRFGGYTIPNSLRLRSAASAYLSRTFGTSTDDKVFTWSGWVKRGSLGSRQALFASGNTTGVSILSFLAGDTIDCALGDNTNTFSLTTSQVLRDPSAWYHIVWVADTTQATAANRNKVWINGVQVTSFSAASYPSQNSGTQFSTRANSIGRLNSGTQFYFDGYISEINFIDGQALTPSSFGYFDPVVQNWWRPKKYTGTYGTNGFYLPFSNGSSTTTLGADASGNGNNWTLNNVSLTAGATYDSMTDTPTIYGGGGNYAVLNPNDKGSGATISEGNLLCQTSTTEVFGVNATVGIASGKFYWEITSGSSNGISMLGIRNAAASRSTYCGGDINGYAYYQNGQKYYNNTGSAYGASWTSGDVIGVAFDADAGSLTFYKNGVSQGVAFTGIPINTWFPAFSDGSSALASADYANFGQRPFAYTPPTGFKALCTSSMPTPTGAAGNPRKYFNALTYAGSASNQTVSGLEFTPDLIWFKERTTTGIDHALYDIVRNSYTGALRSNTTGAESGGSPFTAVTQTGYTLIGGSSQTNDAFGRTYVTWNWKAGGAAVTNTAGSITSQVSANTDAGFSIVTYTGTGANATVGHGLGVAPKMVIVKRRNSTGDWPVWILPVAVTGSDRVLFLNTTGAQTAAGTNFNSSSPTSTVINVGTNAATNGSGGTYVAYVFAEIPGYSKFGSYTGNGSADGPFVYCGFRPRWIMFKRTDTTVDWQILDTARNTSNLTNLGLYPNLSLAEQTETNNVLDITANGFKVRGTGVASNVSGGTYIFAAFADLPFQLANAR